jgi:hypothetical protein
VDTARISGDVTAETVATFRYINPTEVDLDAAIITDTIYVEYGSVKPSGAKLEITDPVMAPYSRQTTASNRDLKITTTGNLTEAVIIFWFGNIRHRLPVKKI